MGWGWCCVGWDGIWGDTGRLRCNSPNWPQFPLPAVRPGRLCGVWGAHEAPGLPTPLLLQALLSDLQAKRDAWRTMKYMELFIVADNTLVSATGGQNVAPCRKARNALCSLLLLC